MREIIEGLKILSFRMAWGPIVILTGLLLLITTHPADVPSTVVYFKVAAGLFLCIAGVALMFVQHRGDKVVQIEEGDISDSTSLAHAVKQLGKNYEILRAQTNQGFFLSGVFMALGFIVIVATLIGDAFGLTTSGFNLGTAAGIVLEFISGTAMLLYRMNFKRLNDTSDRLDETWRILSAHQLAESLPDEQRSAATLRLIDALIVKSRHAQQEATPDALPSAGEP